METNVSAEIRDLENRLRELRSSQVAELKEKLREARQTVADLEAQVALATGVAAPAAKGPKGATGRRVRTSSDEVRGRIIKALSDNPEGLSQKEISDISGLNYNTVVIYLKNNGKDFKTTGVRRSKRFFLR